MLLFVGLLFGSFAPGVAWGRSRAFMSGLLVTVVFTAAAVVSYFIAPDWMWMYFLEPSDLAIVVPVIVLGYFFVYAVGFAASVGLARTGRRGPWVFAAWAVISEVAVLAVTWDRYHLIGTVQQWRQGDAYELISLTPSGPARAIGLLSIPFVVALVVSLLRARRRGHEIVVGR